MANALRGSMDAAESKHVVLGLIFLKYISDASEEHHARQPMIGQIIDLIRNIGLGGDEARSNDVHGRVYDFCSGSAGMLVQSVEFVRAHASGNGNGGKARADISIYIYGQESNYATWCLAKMSLAIRSIDGQVAQGDSLHNDRFPDLKADYIFAKLPFNMESWDGEKEADECADVPGFCSSVTL